MNANQKPEYVLKRANDLINSASSGTGEKEKQWALEMLHSFIGTKRKVAQWSKVFESIMKRHLELCVDLKNHLFAKDGLHQYRNLCQVLDPASLEIVILHLLDLTESRANAARQRANRVALAAAAKISDLDQEESPESIMLSSMTEEGDRDRTSRQVVVPWLKFLWETYRAVLELLSKIPKLEKVYHKTCEKAFKFCQDYERKMEFRRLCEMLRLHLAAFQRSAATPTAARTARNTWDWTPETIEMHLQSRLQQLEVATNLELWNEAFRTVDDIYSIMMSGRRNPRPKLMSVYYEKLTRIFWVSENYLFHAYAWYRYYNLICDYRKDIKAEEKSILASCVLLSALSVPSLKDAEQAAAAAIQTSTGGDDDEFATEKHQQMATLLDFEANPTRKALLADIASKGVLADVPAELAALYTNLEVKFHPLTLTKSIIASIAYLKSVPQLAVYAMPLQRVVVFRVIQQLSKVYEVVKISFVRKLMEGLEDISLNSIEKIMIDGVVRKQFQLKVDHIGQCIRFGSGSPDASHVEAQVQTFGNRIADVIRAVDKTIVDEAVAAEARKVFLKKVADVADKELAATLDRKNLIEQRKIEIEKVQDERDRITQLLAEEDARRRKEEEDARLEKERIERENEKAKQQLDKEDVRKTKRDLEKFNVIKDEAEIAALSPSQRLALVVEARQGAIRAKEDQERKLSEQAKRLDHITRALRIEAAPIIIQRRADQIAADLAAQEIELVDKLKEHKCQHEQNLLEKARYTNMQSHRIAFEAMLGRAQQAEYDRMIVKMRHDATAEHRNIKIATARKLHHEEMQRREEEEELERERKLQEEAERKEQELYEKTRRARQEKEEREREREREKELKARELEAARAQKLADQKNAMQAHVQGPPASASASSSSSSTSSSSSQIKSGGATSSWGRDASAAASAASSSPAPKSGPSTGVWRSSASASASASASTGRSEESGGWGRAKLSSASSTVTPSNDWRKSGPSASGPPSTASPALEEGGTDSKPSLEDRWSTVGSGNNREKRSFGSGNKFSGSGSGSGGGDSGDWRRK